MKEQKLAIIIPYYKRTYIHEAIASIKAQTNRNFHLYIGDDQSAYPLYDSLQKLNEDFRTHITYVRFENNLGSCSLVQQWDRCVQLSRHEPYIWLFSDDDLMPPDAVERFYSFISNHHSLDLCRFDLEIIDDKGNVIRKANPHPALETAEQFVRRRFAGNCISTACEYIFSRKIYEEKKGFIDLPLAWAADDATWIRFAEDGYIYTIPGTPVSWRMSGLNISSDRQKNYAQKFEAAIRFLLFLEPNYAFTKEEKLRWLLGQLYLVQPSKEIKANFFKQINDSQLFSRGYIRYFLIRNKIKNVLKKISSRANRIFGK